MFCKKGVLRNFAKSTGKQLRLSLFFNKVAGLRRCSIVCVAYFEQIFHEVFGWGFVSFELAFHITGVWLRPCHYGNSCLQMFFKIGALKNFVIFTGKHLCWSLFRSATLLKRGSNTGAFL